MRKKLIDLNLEDDFLFAKVMNDKEICKEFLEKLLNIKITKIQIPENQKPIEILLESKGIRLDIYVNDENNTVYNVEMQRGNHSNISKRIRYYQGNIDLDLISKGENYDKLTKTYIIFICTFDLFNAGRHKYTFETVCIEDNSVKLSDGTHKIILNTKGFIDDVNLDLKEFLQYVSYSNDCTANSSTGTLVKKIHKKVLEVKNNPIYEVELMTLYERDREMKEEGREEGKVEKQKEIAKNLLDILSDDIIAEKCELTVDEVKKIRSEHNTINN